MAAQGTIAESLEALRKDWDIDPLVCDLVLGRAEGVADRPVRAGRVVFHIPYLEKAQKYVLWKCLWPDCHNCCDKQGRLPLTSDDLITIGRGLKYQKVSEFVRAETITASHAEDGPSGQRVTMTTVNLRRKDGETEADDGTRIPCRFLDEKGGCSMHPDRPGVCYMYPFSSWLQSEGGAARVHASYQLDGECPGFYLADSVEPMRAELDEYSDVIYRYSMASGRTERDGLSASSIG